MIFTNETDIINAINCLQAIEPVFGQDTTVYDIGNGDISFGNNVTKHTICTTGEYLMCIKELSEGTFVQSADSSPAPRAPIKPIAVKAVMVKVMLFDKPYEFTVCYYTETFELVSAFESKMNQSVMWSQPIKGLIINELKNGVEELS